MALAGALQPSIVELALVGFACLIALVALSDGQFVSPNWNYVVSPILSVGLATGVVTMVSRDSATLWAPLMWWRVVTILYTGIGSMLPLLASAETVDYANGFFKTYPADSLKYTAVCATFSLVVLSTLRISCAVAQWRVGRRPTSGAVPSEAARFSIRPCALSIRDAGFVILLIGIPIKLVVSIVPLLTGVDSSAPVIMATFENIASLGYALLVAHYVSIGSRKYLWIILLVAAEIFIATLQFNKSNAVFPVILMSLGYIYARPSFRAAAIAGATAAALFVFLQPLTGYGRSMDWEFTGNRQPQISRSLSIISTYLSEDKAAVEDSDVSLSWARIAYFPAGSFAINQYDNGVPGDSYKLILITLVPRAIWREKPVITEIGAKFNFLATGNENSQSSPGIPAEAYWNAGWVGVLAAAAGFGLIMSFWSFYSVAVMTSRAWHLMPVVLLGIRSGTRIDGLLAIDIIPGAVLSIVLHYGLTIANELIMRQRMTVAARAAA
ncbi:hypothetical protein M9980_07615 [Sphingomonas donggukensis]|uniref:Oligosaccharide repeat unit polymerase n=1 Tax=Sphingomonas donggukensis TaxID=2949093 RepID=A0ABY4TRK1_9SPHN|nr:hypothetical protein [Sphingomonas donggukensis]URW74455.1 hypothetical protein M9980_07615 [Sphingomonas donggukensis]